jgi:uncharacterized protein (DUF433 family)
MIASILSRFLPISRLAERAHLSPFLAKYASLTRKIRVTDKKTSQIRIRIKLRQNELEEKSMPDPLRIVLDPTVLVGKPVIRGTRLSVDFIIGLMADGWSEVDILRNYPGLSHDDLPACLAYARDVLRSEKIYPSAA